MPSSLSPYLDSLPTTSLSVSNSSGLSFLDSSLVPSNAPLTLPRLWYGDLDYGSLDRGPFDNDFQSNALEIVREGHTLAGLGIRYPNPSDILSLDARPPDYESRYAEQQAWMAPATSYDLATTIDSNPNNAFQAGSFGDPKSNRALISRSTCESLSSTSDVADLPEELLSADQPMASNTALHFEGDLAEAFKRLSSLSGLSVEEFAAQLSATAEASLKNLTVGRTREGQNLEVEVEHWPPLSITTPEMMLPFADVNMRVPSAGGDLCRGVNPADIMPPGSESPSNHSVRRTFLVESNVASSPDANFPDERPPPIALIPIEFVRDPTPESQGDTVFELTLNGTQDAGPMACEGVPDGTDDDRSVFQSPSSSEYSPSLEGGTAERGLPKNNKRRISRISSNKRGDEIESPFPQEAMEIDQHGLLPVNLGTPVFDAHRGVDLEELKAKAERYRLRNQGQDYDKRWLISFAGKLSAKGELVDEFRCYVIGCRQTNKRRDHILIHVGAHLDQRLFKCPHCAARFLRKNECKRHELSHTGIRPYTCHLCPNPGTTFVRQDLLKRHMKRTHRFDVAAQGKENKEPSTSRPKKRIRV